MLAVPPAILDLLHLHAGTTVGLAVDHGRLVIEPTTRPHYSLEELLAQCDASIDPGIEDRAWLDNGLPVTSCFNDQQGTRPVVDSDARSVTEILPIALAD